MSSCDLTSKFAGSSIKELPIGFPFKSKVIRTSETFDNASSEDFEMFIILPIKIPENASIENMEVTCNVEPKGNSQTYIKRWEDFNALEGHVFGKWNFISVDANYWIMTAVGKSTFDKIGRDITKNQLLSKQNRQAESLYNKSLRKKYEKYPDSNLDYHNIECKNIAEVDSKSTEDPSTLKNRITRDVDRESCMPGVNASSDNDFETNEKDSDIHFHSETIVKVEVDDFEIQPDDIQTNKMSSDKSESDDEITESCKKRCSEDSDFDPFDIEINEVEDSDEYHPRPKRRKAKNTQKRKYIRKGNHKTKSRSLSNVSSSTQHKSRRQKKRKLKNSDDETETYKEGVETKEQKDKNLERIKVTLEEHTDKYKVEIMESFARKDRGKSKEACGTEVLLCTVCGKYRSKNKDIMENHLEYHVNGELNCDECDFIAAFVGDLQKHKRLEHKKNITICHVCGAETTGKDGLKDHMGKVHDQPRWECKHCFREKGVKFACITKTKFRQHLRSDHPEKLVECEACKRLFANKYQLQKHLNTGCPGDGTKQYPCEICGKTYASLQLVNNHIARVHNKVRKYQCKLCPFAAANAASLAQHLHTHTGYHPFRCDQCSFSCIQSYQLVSHMRTHTGEKPYKCSECNYAAAWNVQLKDHVKVHSLSNTVSCDKCSIVFKDSRGLKSHQAREHS